MKASGWAWVVAVLPGVTATALPPAWTRRIAIGMIAAVAAVVAVGARFTDVAIGPVSLAFDPVFAELGVDGLLLANWHLLALGVAGTIAFAWRRILGPDLGPLTLVVAACAGWIALLAAFPWLRAWGADSLGLNRTVLVAAPVVAVWMVVAFRGASAAMRAAAPAEAGT